MVRTNPTLRSLAVLAILLAICCAGTAFMRANLSRPASNRMPRARLLWEMPASSVKSISLSSSGRFVTAVRGDSQVACYDSSGTKRFAAFVLGATNAVTSPDGECTLAYSHMNRANTALTFLDKNGRVSWQMQVAGAIWSADAGNSLDEACFAIGTGARYVYLISIRGASKHYRRWRAPGAVCSVSLSPNCEMVTYGTWQKSSVTRSDLTGHKHWQLDVDNASLHHVQTLKGSGKLFVVSVANRWNGDGEAWLARPNGRVENGLPLYSSEKTLALPAPDGGYICTGYTKAIRHSEKSTPERHVALYNIRGKKLWDKGSLLMPTTPVLVMQSGIVLVAGSKNAILAVSPAGEVKQLCKLPSAVDKSIPSRDGLRALLFCADGRIRFLQVSP